MARSLQQFADFRGGASTGDVDGIERFERRGDNLAHFVPEETVLRGERIVLNADITGERRFQEFLRAGHSDLLAWWVEACSADRG